VRAWIEDGVLYILPTLSEHAAVAALAGRPLTPGPVPIRGTGLAGGFRVLSANPDIAVRTLDVRKSGHPVPPLPPTEERP